MTHSNIAFFIPHLGCKHRCSFCNQHVISGAAHAPSPEEVTATCRVAWEQVADRRTTQIAFFGGSFTAIDRDYRRSLLQAAQPFLGADGFHGIRVSTRPDAVDPDILAELSHYGINAVELGAQSMCDEVLALNERGHDAQAVKTASRRIRSAGMELGLQVMVGLYGSTPETERETLREILALSPDTVRIYPTVILRGTALATRYESGEYVPLSMQTAVALCAEMLDAYERAGIRVIRCGLHASEGVETERIGGLYHPAFRELCDSARFFGRIEALGLTPDQQPVTLLVHPTQISKAVGHKRVNVKAFAERGIFLNLQGDPGVAPWECITLQGRTHKENTCT